MKWLSNSFWRDADGFQRDTQYVTVVGDPQPPPDSPHTVEALKNMGLVGIYTDDPLGDVPHGRAGAQKVKA